MFKLKVEWIVALVLFVLCLALFTGFENKKEEDFSIRKAQHYMQLSDWDSAKIHASYVLAHDTDEKDVSMARTIITLASENIESEYQSFLKEKDQAFENLDMNYGENGQIRWYKDKTSSSYESQDAFYLYMGKRGNDFWMRYRIQFSANDYLFINQCQVDTETAGYSLILKEKVVRKHGVNKVYELMDEAFTPDMYMMFKDIANSPKAVIRFIGAGAYEERMITGDEKQAIRNVLKAYELSLEAEVE